MSFRALGLLGAAALAGALFWSASVEAQTAPAGASTTATQTVTVANTDGVGVWLRDAPDGDQLTVLPEGTSLAVVGAQRTAGGRVWQNVRTADGTVGWVAGDYLVGATAGAGSAGAAPAPAAAPAGVAIVTGTAGDGLVLRDSPAGDLIDVWPDGTQLVIIGSPRTAAGRTWQNVRDPDGNQGWAATEYLSMPAATATPTQTVARPPAPAAAQTTATPSPTATSQSTPAQSVAGGATPTRTPRTSSGRSSSGSSAATTATPTQTPSAQATTTPATTAAPATSGGPATVNVVLSEWSITTDLSTVPAGPVTFSAVVQNAQRDHQMNLFRVDDRDPNKLPIAKDGREVDELAAGFKAGEMEGILPNEPPVSDTWTLTPGHYAIFCNLPGHYQLGMVTTLEVK
jgi:uncharacterized cupredoxin-like copper-binding protein